MACPTPSPERAQLRHKHTHLHAQMCACMSACMSARMHAWADACTHGRGTRLRPCMPEKATNPPGKRMARLGPVPLVWRPLFSQRRSTIGVASSRYEGDSSPEVVHQAQMSRPFGLETGFPPKTVEILAVFRRRSQVQPAGAYGLHANRAAQQNTEVRHNFAENLQNCTHTRADTPHAHPCIQ